MKRRSKNSRHFSQTFLSLGCCLLCRAMDRIPFGLVLISFLLFSVANAEEEGVKLALVSFMDKLSPQRNASWGWDPSTDPCKDNWLGVTCDSSRETVKKIVLDQLNLNGVLDAASLCNETNLLVLSLNSNSITGDLVELSNCKQLTHLYLNGNRFSGNLPSSLKQLSNLKRFDIGSNEFSGELPDMSKISGLLSFLVQDNRLTGKIPKFDFSNLQEFNVSNNNLSGPIPDDNGLFGANSFSGNPYLCGKPLSNACPLSPGSKKASKRNKILIYSGYIILGLIVVLLIAIKFVKKKKRADGKSVSSKDVQTEDSGDSSEFKNGNRSEFSITSVESGGVSSSLVVLSSPVVNGLRFEDLLRAPAELIGRGKHGSVYKVIPTGGVALVVKRIKDWHISRDDFKKRMERIDLTKHPRVMPIVAYYCSKQEKLLVYEYQKNGSLFSLLHGSKDGQMFDWGSRLNVAARIADALAFMHQELQDDKIAHGNLKSSNILLNDGMEPCISEYGLMVVDAQDQSTVDQKKNVDHTGGRVYSTFKVDVYGFGVILLELLTGKVVQNNGVDLAKWVHSVVKEEWTCEVFDRSLTMEGASEERMVNLLQIALKCINPVPDERPRIADVATMINSIKEDDERSMTSSDP